MTPDTVSASDFWNMLLLCFGVGMVLIATATTLAYRFGYKEGERDALEDAEEDLEHLRALCVSLRARVQRLEEGEDV